MKVDIAIMTVRPDEFTAVRRRFKTERRRIPDGRTYLIGEVKTEKQTYTIAIARCSEQGTDASQRLAHYIIHNLDPQLILVVGIAGGVPRDEFTLGDVVVSTRIVNPNVDAWHPDGTTDYTTGGGPPHPLVEDIVSLLPDEPQLAGWTETIQLERPTLDPEQANLTGDEEWREKVRKSLNWHFGEEQNRGRPPTYTIGPILSSNHLMKDPAKLREILKTHRSILAVEMEAAGVYEAAQGIDHQYPVLAIRGISDIVGLQRESRWTEYACQAAAAFMYAFIMADPLDPPLNSASAIEQVPLRPDILPDNKQAVSKEGNGHDEMDPPPQPQGKEQEPYIGSSQHIRTFERQQNEFDLALVRAMPGKGNYTPAYIQAKNKKVIDRVMSSLAEACEACDLWWFAGGYQHGPACPIKRLAEEVWLIQHDECKIIDLWAYRHPTLERQYVLLHLAPQPPFGLYRGDASIDREEAGYYKGRYVTRGEYDDGYAEIDEEVIELQGVELRSRNLKDDFYVLVPKYSAYHQYANDQQTDEVYQTLRAAGKIDQSLLQPLERLARAWWMDW